MSTVLPVTLPAVFGAAPAGPPPDTDRYIWRYVTKVRGEDIISELTQIGITQP